MLGSIHLRMTWLRISILPEDPVTESAILPLEAKDPHFWQKKDDYRQDVNAENFDYLGYLMRAPSVTG
ncbi:hypothetical protein N7539_004970 [Penicillium diatomitis]|uniref:Uncharacterized protein n=1 Tax=Penicillium diatomitis TaxID=2819901 RepID=A0A9X0BUK1_9EURO|nr:uncharacterized protein N7539_004970 [Penicillium diatomitis]KAJ5484982.1 hypothetical protein N7539_004970 [Penicillium diatomitis]